MICEDRETPLIQFDFGDLGIKKAVDENSNARKNNRQSDCDRRFNAREMNLGMTILNRVALAILGSALLSTVVMADDRRGAYWQLSGGITLLPEQDIEVEIEGEDVDIELEADEALFLASAVGYQTVFDVAGELEPTVFLFDDARFLGGFANAVYMPTTQWPIKPYAGFGVGVLHADFDDADNDTNLALQAKVGIFVPVSSFDVGLSYHYQQVRDLKSSVEINGVDADADFKDLDLHTIALSVRF